MPKTLPQSYRSHAPANAILLRGHVVPRRRRQMSLTCDRCAKSFATLVDLLKASECAPAPTPLKAVAE